MIVSGARVKIDGPLGDGAQIGANAVVLKDVPPGTVAVGVPAEVRIRPVPSLPELEVDDPAIYI